MKSLHTILFSLLLAGCAGTSAFYPYRASNDNCNCEEYHAVSDNVEYTYRALYRMEKGLQTTIDIEIRNEGADTLSLEFASVKVSSRNIAYQYNNKFLPMPSLRILPHRSENVLLDGKSVNATEDWNKIAGEKMTVTIQGMRLGGRELPPRSVEFIPFNPKMER